MVMAVQGQIFSQSQQPMHRGWSMMQVACRPGYSGPGTLSMQSTGQTAMHTSQPVQLSGLMSALGRPFLGCAVVTAMAGPAYAGFFSRSETRRLTSLPSAAPAALAITYFMMGPWAVPTLATASSTSFRSASSESGGGR